MGSCSEGLGKNASFFVIDWIRGRRAKTSVGGSGKTQRTGFPTILHQLVVRVGRRQG